MSRAYVAFNAGSSSIKFSAFTIEHDSLVLAFHGEVENIVERPHFTAKNRDGRVLCEKVFCSGKPYEAVVTALMTWLEENLQPISLDAVGHRVVHGGNIYAAPTMLTPEVLQKIDSLTPLAPLHQPHAVQLMRALSTLHPRLKQVACFDTSFHLTNSRISRIYALPYQLTDTGIMRYGFHGLSYEHIANELPKYEPCASGRVVVAHLGSGASMCAMLDGKSVTSTMGFSTLDGLPMGTRSGSIDPGVLLYLMQERKWTLKEVENLLYHDAGLAGVSGLGSDMRQLLESSDAHACEAVELFAYRIARELGSMAAAIGGIDALVFTGGIGEHAAPVRARACALAAWLGIRIDQRANTSNETCISAMESSVSVLVLPANEEIVIADHTRRLTG